MRSWETTEGMEERPGSWGQVVFLLLLGALVALSGSLALKEVPAPTPEPEDPYAGCERLTGPQSFTWAAPGRQVITLDCPAEEAP